MSSIQSLSAAQTRPHGSEGRGRPTVSSIAATEPVGDNVGDKIDLSPAARHLSGAGNSSQSTANKTHAILEVAPELAEQPFGRIVSQVARGLLSLEDVIAEAPGGGGDATEADGETEASQAHTLTLSTEEPSAFIGDLIEDLTEGLIEDNEPVDLIA